MDDPKVIGEPRTMAWHHTEHVLVDERSGIAHRLTIDLPHRHNQLDAPPLLLCLDGAWIAGTVRDATRIMSMAREAPEAIVVGLSFDEPDMATYLRRRAEWFSPTQWSPPPEAGVRGVDAAAAGRGPALRRFIRDQVLPLVSAQHPHGERWLIGHSFSALFGLHTLFTEPGLFGRYLLASPSIWWHDRAIFDSERAWAKAESDLPASVVMTAGHNEGGIAFDDSRFRMRQNVHDLADTLVGRNYPSLHLATAVLPGESHSSTIGPAVALGLRALHAPQALAGVGDQRLQQWQLSTR